MSASQEEEDPKKPPYDLRQEKQRLLMLSCSSPPLGTELIAATQTLEAFSLACCTKTSHS
jgi:hypothetical protein